MAVPPRANFNEILLDVISTSPSFGKPVSDNITVTVYKALPDASAPQTTLASIYNAEVGNGLITNPFTLPMAGLGEGEVSFWANPGTYDIKIVDASSPKRFADKVVRWDSMPYDEGVSSYNLDPASLSERLGVSDYSTVRRGKSIVLSTHTTNSTSYVLMSTPDRVQNVKLPTDGIIWVGYSAELYAMSTVARAALFLGASQVSMRTSFSITTVGTFRAPTTVWNSLFTTNSGAANPNGGAGLGSAPMGNPYQSDKTTGQVLGINDQSGMEMLPIFASAGTYDVSVRFLTSSGGQAQVRNRRLFVKTETF